MVKNSQTARASRGEKRRGNRITDTLATVVADDTRHRIGGATAVSRGGLVYAFSLFPVAALFGYWIAAAPGLAVALTVATLATVFGLAWISTSMTAGQDHCYCPESIHAIRYPDRCCRDSVKTSF